MWIFFRTFAPDLGIVPSVTIKYIENMDKVEICKVQIGQDIYKVNQMCENGVMFNEYKVMHGRRIQKGGSYFNDRLKAIQFMLRVAFEDVSQGTIVFEP